MVGREVKHPAFAPKAGRYHRCPMDAPADDALAATIQAGRVIDLAGVSTLLRSEDPRLAGAMAATLGDCPLGKDVAELRIIGVSEAVRVPPGPPTEDYGAARLWRDQGVLVAVSPGVLSAQAQDGCIRLVPGSGTSAHVGRAFRQLLPFILAHALAPSGKVVLHAGAFLDRAGAVVVLGGTGSGKSTLVYAAREHGRGVLADDLVVLVRHGEAVQVAGIPRPFAVDAADPTGLPAEARPVSEDQRGRWQFPLDGRQGWHEAVGVVNVGHSAAPEGAVSPFESSRAWDLVLGSFPAAADAPRLRAALPALAALSRLPMWRLEHGADATTRLGVAGRLLDEVERARSATTAATPRR